MTTNKGVGNNIGEKNKGSYLLKSNRSSQYLVLNKKEAKNKDNFDSDDFENIE